MIRTTSLALLILFGVAGSANAGVVDSNWGGVGASADGNNLTLDEATGFYWLDIDVHFGTTAAEVDALLQTPAYDGFALATRAQVHDYFDALGLLPYMDNWPAYNGLPSAPPAEAGAIAAVESAYTHTGKYGPYNTWGTGSVDFIATGIAANDNGSIPTGTAWTPYIETFSIYDIDTHNFAGVFIAGDWLTTAQTAYDRRGAWLFSATRPVPEPSTFSMLAFCGFAMAGYTRLRRRRK